MTTCDINRERHSPIHDKIIAPSKSFVYLFQKYVI